MSEEDTSSPEQIAEMCPTQRDRDLRLLKFINLFEIAHHHYNLQVYLLEECTFITSDSHKCDILKRLAYQTELKDTVNMLDAVVMLGAIQDRIQQLKLQELGLLYPMQSEPVPKQSENGRNVRRRMSNMDDNDDDVERSSTFTEEDSPPLDEDMETSVIDEPNELYEPPRDPVYELVRQAREEGCIMDVDPQVELDEIEKYCQFFYEKTFSSVSSKLESSERTVMFYYITNVDTTEDFKTQLSEYGEIEEVYMHNSGKSTKTAVVTFKYPEAGKIAPFIRPKICPSIHAKVEPPRPPMSDEEVCEEVSKAKDKYKELRNFYVNLLATEDEM